MNRKNIILAILIAAVIALLIIIALKARVANTPNAPVATPSPAADATLTLHLTQLNIPQNGATLPSTINVEVNSGSHSLTCAQFSLSYDPAVLKNVIIKPGDFLHNPTELPAQSNPLKGIASYAICMEPTSKPSMGKGTVAVVTFTLNPTAKGETTMAFTGHNVLAAAGNTQTSVLLSTQNAVIPLQAK